MNSWIVTARLAVIAAMLSGIAGSTDAEPKETPRTDASWYNTYATDAIEKARKRDQVIVIRERTVYVPYRYNWHERKEHVNIRKGKRRIHRHSVKRPGNRGTAYNPRAALLRSGISR